MDSRVLEHAEVIVGHCTDVQPGDDVLIQGDPMTEELQLAIAEACGSIGANVSTDPSNPRVGAPFAGERVARAHRRAIDPADIEESAISYAAMEATDVLIMLLGSRNAFEISDIDPEVQTAFARANKRMADIRLETRRVATQHPTPGDAQLAQMSTAAYADFVYDATLKDWDAVGVYQQQLVNRLEPASTLRIVAGSETDLRMSIAGNGAHNDDARRNLPGGEVFTAPVPDSVTGQVRFDYPVMVGGCEVPGVYLRFEDGRVIHHDADKHADVLESMLDTDSNARRIGEVGIGMNRDIDRFTKNMLFDEKMAETVHLALGRAYPEVIGDGNERNDSAIHQDILIDMSVDSELRLDGESIQRNGTFVFDA